MVTRGIRLPLQTAIVQALRNFAFEGYCACTVTDDVWHEGVRTIVHHDGGEDKVISSHVLEYVLNIQPGNQTTLHTTRLSTVMKKLGWERASNGYVSITGLGRVKGYFSKA
jgi:hypothetical protein